MRALINYWVMGAWILRCVGCFGGELTLEEKVGQMLMAHFVGEVANEDARILIQEAKVGGIIYYNWANGLNSPKEIQMLSEGLQTLAEKNRAAIPLLIAVDQEGKRVARLRNGFTLFPDNEVIGMSEDFDLAESAAMVMGKEMRAVGINMNLAPVVDVNSNLQNPVIGSRSFGTDPKTVTAFAKRALEGYKKANVIATLKHFPGHGDVRIDSHEDLPVVYKTKEELEKVELYPFAHLAPFAEVIMTAHILVQALDPEYCATLSKKTLGYLRETIGFQGVILSDSLVMQGVLKNASIDEVAIQAINAGCDMLILGGRLLVGEKIGEELSITDVLRIHHLIVQAVKSGRIPLSRIDESVNRILKLKRL